MYALLCMTMIFKKTEMATTYEMQSVICLLNARNIKLVEIHQQIYEINEAYVMSDSIAWRWVQLFNEGLQNVR